MNGLSPLRTFNQSVREISLDTYRILAHKHGDSHDILNSRLLFRDSMAITFRYLVASLSRASGMPDPLFGQGVLRVAGPDSQKLVAASDIASKCDYALRQVQPSSLIPPEYLGVAYENLVGYAPTHGSVSAVSLHTNTERRDNGVFLTPPNFVAFVVEETLRPSLKFADSPEAVLVLTVLDPAVGPGFFLLEALRVISRRVLEVGSRFGVHSELEARRLVAEKCLYGVDVDPLAIELTKALLWFEVKDASMPFNAFDNHIKLGDSLLGLSIGQLQNSDLGTIASEDTKSSSDLLTVHDRHVHRLVNSGTGKSSHGLTSVRPFCWELEFPNIFLDELGHRKEDGGFDFVLTNPPWGKIKPDIKEFYSHLDGRVSEYQGTALRDFVRRVGPASERALVREAWNRYINQTRRYAEILRELGIYTVQRVQANGKATSGDPDLYKYFMERAFQLSKRQARIGLVTPAAFNNTEGAAGIRKLYLENGTFEQMLGFENRKRIFSIHGMFRFLVLVYQKNGSRGIQKAWFGLSDLEDGSGAVETRPEGVGLSFNFIKRVSGDLLTIPELRSEAAQKLFDKLHRRYPPLGKTISDAWNVSFVREVDMTNDSYIFKNAKQLSELGAKRNRQGQWNLPTGEVYHPLLEGRMVNQFDHAAKAYVTGEGRKAQWEPLPFDRKVVTAHYFIPESFFVGQPGTEMMRAGFCDVTGHANERSVLATLIPAMFPCGNKVPTCRFSTKDPRTNLIWTAIANSFVIDWLVRRRLSTTLNFFQWYQVPFVRVSPDSEIGTKLAAASARLCCIGANFKSTTKWLRHNCGIENLPEYPLSSRQRAQVRAEIDALVAGLYDLTANEFARVLSDFPLLDRHQPPLPITTNDAGTNRRAESRSTITQDSAMLAYLRLRDEVSQYTARDLFKITTGTIIDLDERVKCAEKLGATAYIPSELAAVIRPKQIARSTRYTK